MEETGERGQIKALSLFMGAELGGVMAEDSPIRELRSPVGELKVTREIVELRLQDIKVKSLDYQEGFLDGMREGMDYASSTLAELVAFYGELQMKNTPPIEVPFQSNTPHTEVQSGNFLLEVPKN